VSANRARSDFKNCSFVWMLSITPLCQFGAQRPRAGASFDCNGWEAANLFQAIDPLKVASYESAWKLTPNDKGDLRA
jgi:hypothetical protein